MATELGVPAQLRTSSRSFPSGPVLAYSLLGLCAIFAVVQHFWFMSSNSVTMDELVQIESGYRYWQCGDYGVSPENPPLAKLVAAFPVRHWKLGGFAGPCGSQVTPSRGPDYLVALEWLASSFEPLLLWKSRAAMILFTLVLMALTFFSARSLFGVRAAMIATVLLVFEPSLIAHGSLATIDIAFATCVVAAVWAAYEFAVKPTPLGMLLLGVALGLALDSKFLALTVPPLALTIILLPLFFEKFVPRQILLRFAGWLGACVIATLVIWAAYAFRYSALPHATKPSYDFTQILSAPDLANSFWPKLCWFLANHRLLPEAYIAGLATLKSFDASAAYFFGNAYPEGLWYYYPIALLIKLTIPVLLLAFFAVFSPQLWRRNRLAMLTLLLSVVACLAPVMAGQVNMGVRHVLPIVPVVVLLAAAGCTAILSRSRTGIVVVSSLVAFHLISSLHSAPQQISYANELIGGPNHLYRYLDDSNLDWGQSADAIDRYVRSHPGSCAIAWFGLHRSEPPCLRLPTLPYDVFVPKSTPPRLPESFTGRIILQPTAVFWTDAYLAFLRRKPDETIANGSVLVYNGTFDLRQLSIVRRVNRGLSMMLLEHDPQQAVAEFAAVDGQVPPINRPDYEAWYGMALLQLNRPAEARTHFERVLDLTKGHPGFRAQAEMASNALKKL